MKRLVLLLCILFVGAELSAQDVMVAKKKASGAAVVKIDYNPALRNGGFESNVAGEVATPWEFTSVATSRIVDTTEVHSGAHAAALIRGNNLCHITNDCIVAGKTYTLTFWAKAGSGTPNLWYLFGDSDGGYAGHAQALTTTWTEYSVTNHVASASNGLRFLLKDAGVIALIDDVKLVLLD